MLNRMSVALASYEACDMYLSTVRTLIFFKDMTCASIVQDICQCRAFHTLNFHIKSACDNK